ncbi:MAG: hypothetical protein RIR78_521 [Actinomycetota bacterium]
MRSACGCAEWCFHNFTKACGFLENSGSSHSGVPSLLTGRTVQAVKSVVIPMTDLGSIPDSLRTAGTVTFKTST